ncbi:hypothetical protein PF004_g8748 [Phytophthora fragariae]|uniref:Uncharacterized protein n=1 Tax=Phytophthora fragariae TaxID=53985 RepID=A0A6G0Q1I1_9STRA|nr:hypothetical protein PF004_g8748 [Phytophthora fragariae]KAE9265431.1 hypothetical protein PF008_g31864 [Phytophthora fragariae]
MALGKLSRRSGQLYISTVAGASSLLVAVSPAARGQNLPHRTTTSGSLTPVPDCCVHLPAADG